MNYKLHVGDYVETINGEIGFLTDFRIDNDHFSIKIEMKSYSDCWQYSILEKELPNYFNQIGTYQFNKKIKPLKCEITDNHIVFNKINEIIDWINNHK